MYLKKLSFPSTEEKIMEIPKELIESHGDPRGNYIDTRLCIDFPGL